MRGEPGSHGVSSVLGSRSAILVASLDGHRLRSPVLTRGPEGLRLNVASGTTTVGDPLVLWDACASVPSNYNSTFTILGQITALGQCVNMFGGVRYDGVPIGMYPCGGGQPNEMWEFYF